MMFSQRQLAELAQYAMSAAEAAGRIISEQRRSPVRVEHKKTGSSAASQVVTEVDHKSQAAILDILLPSCDDYDLALLTEESADDGKRLEKPAFWSVDPMDGTLAFVEGKPGFSVSVALVARDGTPLIGIVYDPVTENRYQAIRGQGTWKNDQRLQAPPLDPTEPIRLQTDFSFQAHPWGDRTQTGLEDIADQLGLKGAVIQYRVGAVMNACSILETPNRCYFKYPRGGNSGGSLWDYAATACLFHEAGGVACDIHGQPMELNRANTTFMNHRGLLYAGDTRLAERIIAFYRALALDGC